MSKQAAKLVPSLLAADVSRPGGEVISIEPGPDSLLVSGARLTTTTSEVIGFSPHPGLTHPG